MNMPKHVPAFFYASLYLGAIIFMVCTFLGYQIPIYSYRWMPDFGAQFEGRMSQEFLRKSGYVVDSRYGYDGQFYAQLAIDPLILNPETAVAFDNFEYRARRPFFAMTAYLAGAGRPRAVLQAYSVQNLFYWLILAGVLLYWLPPTSWQNTFRYVAILYSIGLVASVQKALLDGPALTLIAIGVLLAELRKPWLSAVVLGVAGLGKETSIFAASLFGLPKMSEPKQVFLLVLKLGIVVLPLALWMFYVSFIDSASRSYSLGSRNNFDWPLLGWWKAIQALQTRIGAGQPLVESLITTVFLIALPVQIIALLWMRQISNLWWRVGATFAAFSFIIGYATWEGVYGSAARICMPVTVAFNLLAPRTRRWLVILILGNTLSLLGLHAVIVSGPPPELLAQPFPHGISTGYRVDWKSGWHQMEWDQRNYWHWSSGVSTLDISPTNSNLSHAVLRFKTRSIKPMEVQISTQDGPLMKFQSNASLSNEIEVVVPLARGANSVYFHSNTLSSELSGDERPLSFMLMNPTLRTK